jgi:hypothetical protein
MARMWRRYAQKIANHDPSNRGHADMRKPFRLAIGIAIVLAFFGYLFWSTLTAQAAECHVCVQFRGNQNCADASAADQKEAIRSAQNTACGPIAQGMDQSIACNNTPPAVAQCRGRH